MSKKVDPNEWEVHECLRKVRFLLKEYNCQIQYDPEVGLILLDQDTKEFATIKNMEALENERPE